MLCAAEWREGIVISSGMVMEATQLVLVVDQKSSRSSTGHHDGAISGAIVD